MTHVWHFKTRPQAPEINAVLLEEYADENGNSRYAAYFTKEKRRVLLDNATVALLREAESEGPLLVGYMPKRHALAVQTGQGDRMTIFLAETGQ